MTRGTYYKVQGWMILDLKLTSYDLIAYAIIYGYSHDGINRYRGSLKNMGELMTASTSTVQRSLRNLEKSGLINKQIDLDKENKVLINYYWANINVLKRIGLEKDKEDTPLVPKTTPSLTDHPPLVSQTSPPSLTDHPPLVSQTTITNVYTNIVTNEETKSSSGNFFEKVFAEFQKQLPDLKREELIDEVKAFEAKYQHEGVKNLSALVKNWVERVDFGLLAADKNKNTEQPQPQNQIGGGSGGESGVFHGGAARFPLEVALRAWKGVFAAYEEDKTKDLPAMRRILMHIGKKEPALLGEEEIIKIVNHVAIKRRNSSFYCNKSLNTISNKLQDLLMEGHKPPIQLNPKPQKSSVLDSGLDEDLFMEAIGG